MKSEPRKREATPASQRTIKMRTLRLLWLNSGGMNHLSVHKMCKAFSVAWSSSESSPQRASHSETGRKMLIDEQKRQRVHVTHDLLRRFEPDGPKHVTGITAGNCLDTILRHRRQTQEQNVTGSNPPETPNLEARV